MKTTVALLVGVAPCENRNVTSLEDTDLLPDSLGSLFFVLSVQNSCGKCGDSLNTYTQGGILRYNSDGEV